ncbi:MAG: type II toxin-antitoxin system VapC family toxin [Candidatus Omnitrophica bacterium]|nr:type II toxin-antitoxin system VapC family toxin [Candidatus Omnitrophota bacterium]
MTYVLDASVLLKWFIQEPESVQALGYRTRLLEQEVAVACPDLALYEVGNVLRHKRGVPERALAEALSDLLRIQMDIFTPTEALLHRAAHLSYFRQMTYYDALYVALAQQLRATLVSADFKLCHDAHGLVSLEPLITSH